MGQETSTPYVFELLSLLAFSSSSLLILDDVVAAMTTNTASIIRKKDDDDDDDDARHNSLMMLLRLQSVLVSLIYRILFLRGLVLYTYQGKDYTYSTKRR